jgi:L-ribulose-5-phosphate 3-epimerase
MDSKRTVILKLGFMQGRFVNSEKKNCIQYFPEKNWPKEFNIANKNNFKIMEWTINSDNMLKNPLYHGNLSSVKKMMKKYKIKIPSLTCDYFMQKPFFRIDKKKDKNKIIDKIKKIIRNGNRIGIKYYIFPLVDNASIKTLTEENILIKETKKLLKLLNKKALILFETDYHPCKIINFIKKFKSRKIGINYDTGNSASLNYNFDDEVKYLKYIKNIHIKDRVLNGHSVRLGKGNWDYKKFFKLIKKNYKGNFILQTARNKHKKNIFEINTNRKFFENEYK